MFKKDVEINILQKYFRHLISSEPILGEIQSYKTIHAGGYRYKNEKKELLSPLTRIAITIEIAGEDIMNYNIEKFAEIIYDFTFERINQMHLMMLETVKNITDFTGNVIDAQGKPFSFDLFLDMLEKLEIRFDDNGNPILPSMVVGTELFKKIKDTKMTKEQEERHNQIIDAKRKQYYAEKRNRRLSFIN
jgi:hypothetical protein